MAKGNLFLGMGRGSVGDVTFYRADGQQLSRVRNRHPRNPKSKGQLYQRAIMAAVIKAYQAGKEIFDHSFEGFTVGAQNQRQFMSLNAKMLRQVVANDVNGAVLPDNQLARVGVPGISIPVPNPWVISRGSYPQKLFSYDSLAQSFVAAPPQEASASTNESVAAYAERVGLIAGDIYTFVCFAIKDQTAYQHQSYDDVLAGLQYCSFGWVRLIVKDGLSSVNTPIATFGQIFDFQTSGGDFSNDGDHWADVAIDDGININTMTNLTLGYSGTGALGLIRSRFDMDLRSDSEMIVNYGTDANNMFGIASEYILDVWTSASVQVGNSDLILEGGDI